MKIGGTRTEPVAAVRRRALAPTGSRGAAAAARVDSAEFLGVPEVEMTPAVKAAIRTLLGELDELRGEVGRLKTRLNEAESLADRDALTPLLNRRAFVRELGRASSLSQRYGGAASLVYFDLDGFKAINDRLGHPAGDAALQQVAARLIANVRDTDVVGRMGGDEFAVVLLQADRAAAEAKAAALADIIEREPLDLAGARIGVRLSYGVAEIAPNADIEALIASADTAMFTAKRQRKAG
ncbi:GGDEF domain-containing protein [Phenylobacterium sp.]|uniref:GGDEF domain-containing protein n=1 Tax=Phenylobacterium sp. TaxID=1871053 RepID=UPI0025F19B87|nr:GGDEF domain-containing protein [Phenylobacterium sp.]